MVGKKPSQQVVSTEDKQSILIETSRPRRLFSEPKLAHTKTIKTCLFLQVHYLIKVNS